MTIGFFLRPAKGTGTPLIEVIDPVPWGIHEKRVERLSEDEKKEPYKVKRVKEVDLEPDGEDRLIDVEMPEMPPEIAEDLQALESEAIKDWLITLYRNKILEQYLEELRQREAIELERLRLLELWEQVKQDEMLLFLVASDEI